MLLLELLQNTQALYSFNAGTKYLVSAILSIRRALVCQPCFYEFENENLPRFSISNFQERKLKFDTNFQFHEK